MARIDADRWRVLSPYLDRALDTIDPHDRAAWLDSLRGDDPALAADLELLLRAHEAARDEGYLDSPVPVVLPEAAAGARVGAYTLLSPIGRGGMGTVWLAERADGRFERRVAIKFLNRTLIGGERRFKREGRILARLAHRHIAQLLDAGVSESGQPYLVLEHVDGAPIDRYCDEHALDVPARLRLFLDVLDAVAHAHASLIVHRDIKPSNVLVTHDGHVKLLDFGIATLLEDEDHEGMTLTTQDGATALTPAFAAPEQVTGQPVSTATDVYALGVLLYLLLTGRHPAGERLQSPADLVKAIVDTEPALPSDAIARHEEAAPTETAAARRATSPDRLRRLLRGDLDTIVNVALKKRPADRFASVTALADDLRRFLRHEPIGARPDSFAYRGARFLRRHRLAVAAGLAIVASLAVGLYAANRQRIVAERRFELVRQLANKLFDVDVAIRTLPGNVAARQLIVDTALDYLARLTAEGPLDPDVALDVGTAYMRVARVQGIPISANLGQMEQADRTLLTAKTFIDTVLAQRPDHRLAFFRQGQIAHDRMIVAGLRRPSDQALPLARESARWLDRYLQSGPVDPAEARQVVLALNNVGNRFRIEEEFDEALRLTVRGVEIARASPDLRAYVGSMQIGMGRIQRDRGLLEEALKAYDEAVTVLDPGREKPEVAPSRRGHALAVIERAELIGRPRGISLGRSSAQAIGDLQRVFAIIDEEAHRDPGDADTRGLLGTAGLALAYFQRDVDAAQALATYDHVLRHLGEIANNARFRRDEVRALAGSADPLRRLGRGDEARQRIDAAFARLRDLKLYPAERIEVGAEPHDALIALAGHYAASGDRQRAIETCDRLMQGIAASQPKPDRSLSHAAALSELYTSVAAIRRSSGQADAAAALDADRRRWWQHWDRKLPNNPFVTAQLTAARVPAE